MIVNQRSVGGLLMLLSVFHVYEAVRLASIVPLTQAAGCAFVGVSCFLSTVKVMDVKRKVTLSMLWSANDTALVKAFCVFGILLMILGYALRAAIPS